MERVCIYCGANTGSDPRYRAAAEALATTLAERGVDIVYGGASVGLMGAVADAALAAGGTVTGVLPAALRERELAHPGLTRLEVVDSMHTRKARMAALSEGFIALPGGLGTLEELFEMLTWGQLGFHGKPFAVLNVHGYYDALLGFLDHAVEAGFLRPEYRALLLDGDDPDRLLDAMDEFQAPAGGRFAAPGP